MGDDALVRSLREQIRALRAELGQLRANVEETRSRVEEATSVSAILRGAGAAPAPSPAPRPRHRRDRHGMHLVKGLAVGAALLGLARWLAGTWPRRIATASAALAVAGGTVLTPPVQGAMNPPEPHHYPRARHVTVVAPGAPPPPRHRHTRSSRGTAPLRHHRGPVASPHASQPPGTQPTPLPVVTPPVPVPTPTLPLPTPPDCDNDCQGLSAQFKMCAPNIGCLPDPLSASERLLRTHRLKLHDLRLAA